MTKFVRVSSIYWSGTTKWILFTSVKVPNFQNPELKKLKSQNLQSTYKILIVSNELSFLTELKSDKLL